MTKMLRRLRRAVADLGAEDRPCFKRVNASAALYHDGSWLKPRHREPPAGRAGGLDAAARR